MVVVVLKITPKKAIQFYSRCFFNLILTSLNHTTVPNFRQASAAANAPCQSDPLKLPVGG